jgi:hypothetical protein
MPAISLAQSSPLAIYLGSSTYPCTAAGVTAALSAIPNGGTIDATNCTGTLTPGGTVSLSVSNVTLLLGQQTWNFSASTNPGFNVTGSGVIIQCKGLQSIITSSYLGSQTPSVVASNFILLTGANDEVRHCQLQGQATQNANNFQVGINITGGSAKITDNVFTGTTGSNGLNWAVSVNGVNETYIERNIIKQIQSPSSGTGQGIITGGTSTLGLIRENHIIFTSANSPGDHQIYISQASSEFDVSDNLLESGSGVMVKLYAKDSQGTCQYNDVHDNILINGGNASGQAGAIDIENNSTHNKVHDNIIWNYANGPGVEVVQNPSATKSPDANQISNNHIFSVGTHCVEVAGGNNTLVQGNDCRNNSTLSAGSYDAFFIEGNISTSNNTQVTENYVTNTGGSTKFHSGLLIGNNSPVAAGTVVSGNSFDIGNVGSAIIDDGSGSQIGLNMLGGVPSFNPGIVFSSLGTPANGTFYYCSDCKIANPCASGGTGAFAKRINGSWVCN